LSTKKELALLDRLHAEHTNGGRPRGYDFDAYLRLERAGGYKVWGARADGEAIAFLSYIIKHNPHYGPDWKSALHDMWYVEPEYRSSIVTSRLWKTAEADLRAMGVKSILHSLGAKYSNHNAALETLGYKHIETVYEKVLK
jgi:hypothetical protein